MGSFFHGAGDEEPLTANTLSLDGGITGNGTAPTEGGVLMVIENEDVELGFEHIGGGAIVFPLHAFTGVGGVGGDGGDGGEPEPPLVPEPEPGSEGALENGSSVTISTTATATTTTVIDTDTSRAIFFLDMDGGLLNGDR